MGDASYRALIVCYSNLFLNYNCLKIFLNAQDSQYLNLKFNACSRSELSMNVVSICTYLDIQTESQHYNCSYLSLN